MEGSLGASLAKDDVLALGCALSQQQGLSLSAFYDWQDPKQGPQQRDLLSMAAAAGAQACVAALLAAGAEPNAPSPSDGNTALHCACSSANSSTARVITLLVCGGADKMLRNHAGLTACDLLSQETSQVGAGIGRGAGSAPGHRARCFPPRPCRRRRTAAGTLAHSSTCAPSTAPTPSACSPSKSTAAPAWPSPTIGRCAHFSTQVRPRVPRGSGAGPAAGLLRGTARARERRRREDKVPPQGLNPRRTPPGCLLRCRREGTAAGPSLLHVPRRALPRFPQGEALRRQPATRRPGRQPHAAARRCPPACAANRRECLPLAACAPSPAWLAAVCRVVVAGLGLGLLPAAAVSPPAASV